jgi:hypothetical protein
MVIKVAAKARRFMTFAPKEYCVHSCAINLNTT